MIAHLWTSTIVLAFALVAARWMPRLTARTRHAIVLAGVAKFAIPSIHVPAHSAISIVVFGVPQRLLKSAPPPHAQWPSIAIAASLVITALLLLRQWLIHHRTLVAALAGATPATDREHAALQRAAQRAGLRQHVDLIRSSIAEAPAVLGILRPVVILPAGRCDALDDEELESILVHECAHVVRHDNLTGVLRVVAGAALWFHPLVWLASRDLSRFAEEACDEIVAEKEPAETYLSALKKVCRAAITSPAGVSCMAGSNLNERMTHLMNYALLRNRSLSHRLVITATVAVVAFCTIAGGVRAGNTKPPYATRMKVEQRGDGYQITVTIIDTTSGQPVAQPKVMLLPGQNGSGRDGSNPEAVVNATVNGDGSGGTANIQLFRDGKLLDQSDHVFTRQDTSAKADGISLDLKDADLRDVVEKFGKLTNHKVDVPADVSGTVTANFVNTPWEIVLEKILAMNGLTYSIDGDTIHVRRR